MFKSKYSYIFIYVIFAFFAITFLFEAAITKTQIPLTKQNSMPKNPCPDGYWYYPKNLHTRTSCVPMEISAENAKNKNLTITKLGTIKGKSLRYVNINNKKGVYYGRNTVIIPVIYDDIRVSSKEHYYYDFIVEKNRKKGLHHWTSDFKGKEFYQAYSLDVIYDDIINIGSNWEMFEKDMPLKVEEYNFGRNWGYEYIVKKDGKQGLFIGDIKTKTIKPIIEIKYDEIIPIRQNTRECYVIKNKNKYAIYDRKEMYDKHKRIGRFKYSDVAIARLHNGVRNYLRVKQFGIWHFEDFLVFVGSELLYLLASIVTPFIPFLIIGSLYMHF